MPQIKYIKNYTYIVSRNNVLCLTTEEVMYNITDATEG